MKKILTFCLLFLTGIAHSAYNFRNSASNINSGILNPLFVSPDTFTLQGNTINFSTVASGSQQLRSDFNAYATTMSAFAGALSVSTTALNSSISASGNGVRPAAIVVGTCPTYGAQVVAQTNAAFDFAVSTLGGLNLASGTIYVQAGTYFYNGNTSTIPANVSLVFDKGAQLVSTAGAVLWNTVFAVSGTIINPNVFISTGIGDRGTKKPIFNMLGNGMVKGGEIRLILENLSITGSPYPLVGYFGPLARKAVMQDIWISSFGIGGIGGSPQSASFFSIDGSTGGMILNPNIQATTSQNIASDVAIVEVKNCDGFDVIGGQLETNQRQLAMIGFTSVSGDFIRGFRMNGMKVMQNRDGGAAGLITVSPNAGVTIASGCLISNIQVQYNSATTSPFARLNGGSSAFTMAFVGNNIWHTTTGNSGGGFSIADANVIKAIFMENMISGSSGCMSDSGTGTQWTNASGGGKNFCNGNSQ